MVFYVLFLYSWLCHFVFSILALSIDMFVGSLTFIHEPKSMPQGEASFIHANIQLMSSLFLYLCWFLYQNLIFLVIIHLSNVETLRKRNK